MDNIGARADFQIRSNSALGNQVLRTLYSFCQGLRLKSWMQPKANPMKLLRVKIKAKFFKFSENESYEALYTELLLKYK